MRPNQPTDLRIETGWRAASFQQRQGACKRSSGKGRDHGNAHGSYSFSVQRVVQHLFITPASFAARRTTLSVLGGSCSFLLPVLFQGSGLRGPAVPAAAAAPPAAALAAAATASAAARTVGAAGRAASTAPARTGGGPRAVPAARPSPSPSPILLG